MSTQNSTRLFFLFALLACFCQLGFAQLSEADFSDANVYVASIDSPKEITRSYSINKEETFKPVFDFSQGVRYPMFDSLDTYVAQHILYPEVATSYGVEGSVVLSLELSSTGEVEKATVKESLGYGCDEAALALVKQMPNWTPASNYGVSVGAVQLVSIDFKLQ